MLANKGLEVNMWLVFAKVANGNADASILC